MFNGKRYLTNGVNQNIPLELQIFMWHLIDNLNIQKDYLQIFNISIKNGIQVIEHKQEVPKYQNIYYLAINNPTNAKVFVIDDGDYSTMLLAEEY